MTEKIKCFACNKECNSEDMIVQFPHKDIPFCSDDCIDNFDFQKIPELKRVRELIKYIKAGNSHNSVDLLKEIGVIWSEVKNK